MNVFEGDALTVDTICSNSTLTMKCGLNVECGICSEFIIAIM